MIQQPLFESVKRSFEHHDRISNQALYDEVANDMGITESDMNQKESIGQAGRKHNIFARKVRWQQQTLKQMGLIERVADKKGVWQLTKEGKNKLHKIQPGITVLGFSTNLGLAVWAKCNDVFSKIDEPIHLVVTSPPYPLRNKRAYGNPDESEYVDFICKCMEPIVKNLTDGGSITLNVSNDIFLKKSPARSLYREQLVIALNERFGLYKMDELIWQNKSKPPGPLYWASINRFQLNVEWEPVYWFCNNPNKVRSNNQRVLQPHTEQHKTLMRSGGHKTRTACSDGAYSKREGSFGKETKGKILRNVLNVPHGCKSQMDYKRNASEIGMPTHGAPFPLKLAKLLVEFLSEKNDLVIDPFAGSFTTALACEELGRRWIGTDCMYEYVRGSAERFKKCNGYALEKEFNYIQCV